MGHRRLGAACLRLQFSNRTKSLHVECGVTQSRLACCPSVRRLPSMHTQALVMEMTAPHNCVGGGRSNSGVPETWRLLLVFRPLPIPRAARLRADCIQPVLETSPHPPTLSLSLTHTHTPSLSRSISLRLSLAADFIQQVMETSLSLSLSLSLRARRHKAHPIIARSSLRNEGKSASPASCHQLVWPEWQ